LGKVAITVGEEEEGSSESPRLATVSRPAHLLIWSRSRCWRPHRCFFFSVRSTTTKRNFPAKKCLVHRARFERALPLRCSSGPAAIRSHVWSQAATRQDDWSETCQTRLRRSPDLDDLSRRGCNPILLPSISRGLFLRARFHVSIFHSSSMRISNRGRQPSLGFVIGTCDKVDDLTCCLSHRTCRGSLYGPCLVDGQKQSTAAAPVPAEWWYGFVNVGWQGLPWTGLQHGRVKGNAPRECLPHKNTT
jgi:hypothetical protein